MNYLIKIFFFFICINLHANQLENNTVLFELNNKVFTKIDFERRLDYISLTNKILISNISDLDKEEIYKDYISSLIFYEYYLDKEVEYEDITKEIDTIYNQIENINLNENQIVFIKENIKTDIIRKKIIEEILNLNKKELLKEADSLDLLYNYNLNYLIFKSNDIDESLIINTSNRKHFNNLKKYLIENNINFLHKDENIDDNSITSKKIKELIINNKKIFKEEVDGYITLISIQKNLESYEGVFVKLINFTSKFKLDDKVIRCDNIEFINDININIFKEYEYSKLNENIRNNLKSVDDYIYFDNDDIFNYIILCELKYDKNLLDTINFNKKVNSLVEKIQINFINKYKNEYKFKNNQ